MAARRPFIEPQLPPTKTFRQRLDEHFGFTVGAVLFGVAAATASVTWSIAKDVLLERKNNEIADLRRELSARPAASPVNPKDPIPAPTIQLQVTATPSPPRAPTQTPSPTPISTPTATPVDPPDDEKWMGPTTHPRTTAPSMEAMAKLWQAITGRFAEESAYAQRFDNAEVSSWDINVIDVSDSGADRVIVTFSPPATLGSIPLNGAVVFRADQRERLLALNRGDVIRITAVLRTAGKGYVLYGKQFTLVRAATPTPSP